jgi:hypothetical protein
MVRSPVKLVRILALICVAALLLAAIAAVPGLDFAILVTLPFFTVWQGLSRDRVLEHHAEAPTSGHRPPSGPRSPPSIR